MEKNVYLYVDMLVSVDGRVNIYSLFDNPEDFFPFFWTMKTKRVFNLFSIEFRTFFFRIMWMQLKHKKTELRVENVKTWVRWIFVKVLWEFFDCFKGKATWWKVNHWRMIFSVWVSIKKNNVFPNFPIKLFIIQKKFLFSLWIIRFQNFLNNLFLFFVQLSTGHSFQKLKTLIVKKGNGQNIHEKEVVVGQIIYIFYWKINLKTNLLIYSLFVFLLFFRGTRNCFLNSLVTHGSLMWIFIAIDF